EGLSKTTIDQLVAAAGTGTWAERARAATRLYRGGVELQRIGLTEAQCVALVRAAAAPWPAADNPYHDPRHHLLLCACRAPYPACLPELLAFYPTLSESDHQVIWQVLMLLSLMP